MVNQNEKSGFDIVVIQTSESGNLRFREIIDEMGISDRVYIFRNFGLDEVFSKLDTSRRQLFITGTIRGNVATAVSMVEILKKKYPNLVCLGYASDELAVPPLDECIIKPWVSEKGTPLYEDKLKAYIRKFLEELDVE